MTRSLLAAALLVALPIAAPAADYALDPGHTEVRFFWDHAGVSEQSGEWGSVTGTISFDPENVEATTVTVTVDASSVDTGVTGLDDHMKSPDMFDVAAHPQITFVSTGVTQTGPATVEVTGDLTIKGITKPLVLTVELVHSGPHPMGQFADYFAGDWLGIKATGSLIRSEFDVGFGVPISSDAIRLEISSELKPQ